MPGASGWKLSGNCCMERRHNEDRPLAKMPSSGLQRGRRHASGSTLVDSSSLQAPTKEGQRSKKLFHVHNVI